MENTAKVYNLKPNIAQDTNEYIEKTKMSITELARQINYSRSALSRYLGGKYDSDTGDIEQAISKYFESIGKPLTGDVQSKTHAERPSFFTTEDAANIIGVCQSCQEFLGLGIVVGHSGFGKTQALKHYARMPRVAYIECDDTMGCRDLVEAIERVLGIPSGYGTIWKRVSAIKEFFNINKGYLLIVDEADKLVNKYTQKKMEILRAIFDQADVGLVIAGEPRLEAMIKGYLTRFANRVDFYTHLKGIKAKEVEKYLNGYSFTPEAMREMITRATNSKTGCFRLLDRTMNNILRLVTQNEEITLDIINKASSMMML